MLRHNSFLIFAIALSASFGAGCATKVHLGGDDAGTGEACGPTTCAVGQVCCNASCGICTEPEGACITLECLPDDGGTPPPVDGGPESCGAITCGAGLVCCNASCGICTEPGGACIELACGDAGVPRACGTRGGISCLATEYCDFTAGCGFADEGGVCVPRPTACPDIFMPVCGCNGVTYSNNCDAAAAGADILHEGACGTPGPCAAMDARGEGACAAFFGYAWNGASCVGLSGCSCVGADCGSTYDTMEACDAAHASCGTTGATCGTKAGLTCGPSEWCNYDDTTGDACGFADGGGTCEPRPEVCPAVFAPVCGCDGRTYGNECEAHGGGVDIAFTGECPVPL